MHSQPLHLHQLLQSRHKMLCRHSQLIMEEHDHTKMIFRKALMLSLKRKKKWLCFYFIFFYFLFFSCVSVSFNCTVLPKVWNPWQFCCRAPVRWAGKRRQGCWSPACTTLCVFGWVSFCRPLGAVIVKLSVLLWLNCYVSEIWLTYNMICLKAVLLWVVARSPKMVDWLNLHHGPYILVLWSASVGLGRAKIILK